MISEICHYLVAGGGKRLRPTFILLVYRACGGTDAKLDDAIDAAIALELIHSATLLHDDIIDGGMLRRGKPSAFSRVMDWRHRWWPAIFCSPRLRAVRPVRGTAGADRRQACIQLTEGEVMEGRMRHQLGTVSTIT